MDKGFKQARAKSKGFIADVTTDLRKELKNVGRFDKAITAITGANAGTLAGSLLGGPALGAALGQLDEMLGVSDGLRDKFKQLGQSIVDYFSGFKGSETQAAEDRLQKEAEISKVLGGREQAIGAERRLLTQGVDAAREYALIQEGISKTIAKNLVAEMAINDAIRKRKDDEERRAQTLHGLRQQVADLGLDPVQKQLAGLERQGLNKDDLGAARISLELIEQFKRQEALADRVQAEFNRQNREAMQPNGPVGALMRNSSGAYSAEQKFQRQVDAQGNIGKLGDPAERMVKLAEKQLKEEQDAKKQREDIKDAIKAAGVLKQAKF